MFFETVDKIFAPLVLALYFASSLDSFDSDPVKTILLFEKKLSFEIFSALFILINFLSSLTILKFSLIEKNFFSEDTAFGPKPSTLAIISIFCIDFNKFSIEINSFANMLAFISPI